MSSTPAATSTAPALFDALGAVRATGAYIGIDAGHAIKQGRYRYIVSPSGVYRDRMVAAAHQLAPADDGGDGCTVDAGGHIHVAASWRRGCIGILNKLADATREPAPTEEPAPDARPVVIMARYDSGYYLFEAVGSTLDEVHAALLDAYAAHVDALPVGQADPNYMAQLIGDGDLSITELRLGQAAIDGEPV